MATMLKPWDWDWYALRKGAATVMSAFVGGLTLLLAPPSAYAQECLRFPVDPTLVTSNFGMRFHPVLKILRLHAGTDFRAATFTHIKASASGMVTYAGWMGGGGNTVMTLNDSGVQNRYLHLSRIFVRMGEHVSQGKVIGESGNTGTSAAPHLHLEARLHGGSEARDPKSLLCSQPAEKDNASEDSAGYTPFPSSSTGATMSSFAKISSWATMSLTDLLRQETERRFLNQEWHRQLMDPVDQERNNPGPDAEAQAAAKSGTAGPGAILKEIAVMLALDAYMSYEIATRKEMIETLLGVRLAQLAKQSAAKNYSAIRGYFGIQ